MKTYHSAPTERPADVPIKVTDWVWRCSQSKGLDRLVLLAIADFADHHDGNVWPSINTLVTKTTVTERSVQRSLNRLVDLGELVVERPEDGRSSNHYTVVMLHSPPASVAPPPAWHPPKSPDKTDSTPASVAGGGAITPASVAGGGAITPASVAPPNSPIMPDLSPKERRGEVLLPPPAWRGEVLLPPPAWHPKVLKALSSKSHLPAGSLFVGASENRSAGADAITSPVDDLTKRGTHLPPDWVPSPQLIAWARGKGIPDDLARSETEQFCRYWWAKAGAGATKRSWALTWQRWITTAADRSPRARSGRRVPPEHSPRVEDALAVARRLREAEDAEDQT